MAAFVADGSDEVEFGSQQNELRVATTLDQNLESVNLSQDLQWRDSVEGKAFFTREYKQRGERFWRNQSSEWKQGSHAGDNDRDDEHNDSIADDYPDVVDMYAGCLEDAVKLKKRWRALLLAQ